MTTELDRWFPRNPDDAKNPQPPRTEHGIIPGIRQKRIKPRGGTKSPQALKRKAEELTRYIFTNLFNAEISKSQVQEIITDKGIFNKSTDVDFVGSMPILSNGTAISYPIKIDAKAWSGASFPLSRVSPNERQYFSDGLRAKMGCLLALVVWPLDAKSYGRGDVDAVYLVPWKLWLKLENQLAGMAAGNFKGKSLRRSDLNLLSGCAVVKDGRRWQLEPDHWLIPLLPGDVAQESIF